MDSATFLSLLHFSDGLFPVGAYAHSLGLESYVAEGLIRDSKGVESFLLSYLEGAAAPTDAIATLVSRKAAVSGSFARERCISIDRTLDALKAAGELRAASRQMGRQLLRVATELGVPFSQGGLAGHLFRAIESEQTPGHYSAAFGVVGAALGWSETQLACAFLYSSCAGLVAAALRLLPLGQLAGQRILWALQPCIARLAAEVQEKDMDDIWSFAPGLEIAAMRHATLDARLFRS